ncbi:PQQ-binding-like beta-propeller repeat protein [Actinocrinis puniceicyclus]|uniref:PQQ-binding-like beta-propeller repeat protein n=1 Tax=Actinocrinis puniceicyclus TaxID=977794 RepID=A0A8J8BCZ8_9ACTN|nr:PQQ-binding-like beta-propeller repeat protein [Actinocrinis puniceicyclus]MBS2963606.1 PQQ-binding-like beta-propeller repeat protein [Actinocrinis puniceicyclus]
MSANASTPAANSTATASGKAIAVGDQDWVTFHRDNARTGVARGVTHPARLNVAWRAHLDGAVYGQPLLLGGMVVAATENDSVYGLSPADGRVLWRTAIGRPQPLSQLPCGDIDPLGITGTPAYDPVTGSLFVLGETEGRHHVLAALDPATGSVRWSRPAEPTAGNAMDAQQRGALTVAFGRVYVPYGGLAGDCGGYVGSVVAIPATGRGDQLSYNVPTPRNGGIWTPGGLVVHEQTLLAAVGNGAETGTYDGSDSVLALTPDLKRADFFAPTGWAADNAEDQDLGSMSPALIGDRVLIAGKRGTAYVLDPHHLGGIGGQVAQLPLCAAYGAAAVAGNTAYLPCHGGLRAVTVTGSTVSVRWQGDPQSASDPPAAGGGAVWSLDDGAGVLYALDEGTGKALAQVNVGRAPHFASPTLGPRGAYVGTLDGVTAVGISAS